MNPWATIVLSALAVAGITFNTTYAAHPAGADVPTIAYVAAIAGAVGSYVLGLFQKTPWDKNAPPDKKP